MLRSATWVYTTLFFATTAAWAGPDEDLMAEINDSVGKGLEHDAVEPARELVVLRRMNGQPGELAEALQILCRTLVAANRLDDALTRCEEAVEIWRDEGMEAEIEAAPAWNQTATVLMKLGRPQEALPIFEQVAQLRRDADGDVNLGVALQNLGSLHYGLGDFPAAKALFDEAIGVERERESLAALASALTNLAFTERQLGDLPAALVAAEESLAVRRAELPPEHPDIAISLSGLSMLLFRMGELPRARSLQEEALEIRIASFGEIHPEVAQCLNNLGLMDDQEGDLAGAEALYLRALAIKRELLGPDHPSVGVQLHNLAVVHKRQGELDRAAAELDESLAIMLAAHGPNHPDVGRTHRSVGGAYKVLGDFVRARHHFEEAARIATDRNGPETLAHAIALHDLASLLHDQGDLDGSEELYLQVQAIEQAQLPPQHPSHAETLYGVAGIEEYRGDHAAAEVLLRKALAIQEAAFQDDHPKLVSPLLKLAKSRRTQGDLEGAAHFADRAETVARGLAPNHPRLAQAMTEKSQILELRGELERARAALMEALGVLKIVHRPDHWNVGTVLAQLARVEYALGNDEAGSRALEQAMAVFDLHLGRLDGLSEREALLYVANLREQLAVWARLSDNSPEEVWARMMRYKGAVSARLRAARLVGAMEPEAQPIANELAEARSQMAHAWNDRSTPSEQLEVLNARAEKLERDLLAVSVRFRDHRTLESPIPADLCGALPPQAAVVDFMLLGNQALVFAMGTDCEVHRVDLGGVDEIEELLRSWRGVVTSPHAMGVRVHMRARRLAERVLDPVLEAVGPDATHLLIVPDGELSTVSFAALPLSDGAYLIERGPVTYLDRAHDLLRPSDTDDTHGALIVGGVDYAGDVAPSEGGLRATPCRLDRYAPLPGAAVEASDVAARWRRARRKQPLEHLEGDSATEARVLSTMAGRAVVHLATHGLLATEGCQSTGAGVNPMLLSGLVLAGANNPNNDQDGILTAMEVATQDLSDTGLVVLSACQTGLGVTNAGEGVLGLRRSFSIAGCETLIMSLWSVPDLATRDLMRDLYRRHLHQRPLPAAEALRQAQLDMLEAQRKDGEIHPFSWGAFVSAGSWTW